MCKVGISPGQDAQAEQHLDLWKPHAMPHHTIERSLLKHNALLLGRCNAMRDHTAFRFHRVAC
jgi:hypothetical protein